MRIKKTGVVQQVTEYMKTRIAGGDWLVGEKIPSENMLIDELGVSRASVRLAVQHFVGLGVLRSVHGKGTFLVRNSLTSLEAESRAVSPEDCADVAKVLEFRMIVEPEGCRLAAKRATPEVIERLASHIASQEKSVGDIEVFFEHDWAFHETIIQASGNVLLEKSLLSVFSMAKDGFRKTIELNRFEGGGHYYHSQILEACRVHDSRRAKSAMKEHLETAYRQARALAAGHGIQKK